MIGCLLLSHGKLAEAYLDAAIRIVGEREGLYAINCEDLAPEALYERVAHLIQSERFEDGLFILVGLRGGSCWNVGARIARDYPRVELLSGVNLAMLLSFLSKRNQYRFEELATVLINDGARGIARLKRES